MSIALSRRIRMLEKELEALKDGKIAMYDGLLDNMNDRLRALEAEARHATQRSKPNAQANQRS